MRVGARLVGQRSAAADRLLEHTGRAVTSTVQIGEVTAQAPVDAGAKEVVVRMTLPAGKTRMKAFFAHRDGGTVGAFYAYVRLL